MKANCCSLQYKSRSLSSRHVRVLSEVYAQNIICLWEALGVWWNDGISLGMVLKSQKITSDVISRYKHIFSLFRTDRSVSTFRAIFLHLCLIRPSRNKLISYPETMRYFVSVGCRSSISQRLISYEKNLRATDIQEELFCWKKNDAVQLAPIICFPLSCRCIYF